MTYQVPLKDIRFVLSELAELPAVCTLPGYEDCNVELVDAILDEAAKFAEGVLAPINRNGDKGNTWKDYQVTTAEGFADAYHQFRDSGWVSGWNEGAWSLSRKRDFLVRHGLAGIAFFIAGYDDYALTPRLDRVRVAHALEPADSAPCR